jgi:hypothetical protein
MKPRDAKRVAVQKKTSMAVCAMKKNWTAL